MAIFAFPVNSSVISVVRYDSDTEVLELGFRSGRYYAYSDVDLDVFHGLINGQSVGQFFADNIRSQYVYEEIAPFLVLNPTAHIFNSTALRTGAYNYDTRVAAFVFPNGRVYRYQLHPATWSDLVRSSSPGAYFNQYIRQLAEKA